MTPHKLVRWNSIPLQTEMFQGSNPTMGGIFLTTSSFPTGVMSDLDLLYRETIVGTRNRKRNFLYRLNQLFFSILKDNTDSSKNISCILCVTDVESLESQPEVEEDLDILEEGKV